MHLIDYLTKTKIPFEQKGDNLTVGGGLDLSGININEKEKIRYRIYQKIFISNIEVMLSLN